MRRRQQSDDLFTNLIALPDPQRALLVVFIVLVLLKRPSDALRTASSEWRTHGSTQEDFILIHRSRSSSSRNSNSWDMSKVYFADLFSAKDSNSEPTENFLHSHWIHYLMSKLEGLPRLQLQLKQETDHLKDGGLSSLLRRDLYNIDVPFESDSLDTDYSDAQLMSNVLHLREGTDSLELTILSSSSYRMNHKTFELKPIAVSAAVAHIARRESAGALMSRDNAWRVSHNQHPSQVHISARRKRSRSRRQQQITHTSQSNKRASSHRPRFSKVRRRKKKQMPDEIASLASRMSSSSSSALTSFSAEHKEYSTTSSLQSSSTEMQASFPSTLSTATSDMSNVDNRMTGEPRHILTLNDQILQLRRAVILWEREIIRLAEKYATRPLVLAQSPKWLRLLLVREQLRRVLAKTTAIRMLDQTRM